MLFLYWFGKIINDNIGNNALISLYVLGGIIGGLFYMAIYNIIPYYADRVSESLMLGASAGVFSVVVGSATTNEFPGMGQTASYTIYKIGADDFQDDAFANNVLESVQLPSLKKRINGQIASKLGVNLGFEL